MCVFIDPNNRTSREMRSRMGNASRNRTNTRACKMNMVNIVELYRVLLVIVINLPKQIDTMQIKRI